MGKHERQVLKAVRNFGLHLFDPVSGPSAEALLAAYRGVALPSGKLAELALDGRQRAAIERARRDLTALVGREWTGIANEERKRLLEAALGPDVQ